MFFIIFFCSAAVSNFAPRGDMKSVVFDGSGDYLTAPDSEDWNMGSGNFTVEAWVFILSYAADTTVVGQWTSSLAWKLGLTGSGYLECKTNNGSATTTLSANNTKVPLNRWTHIAFAKTGSYSGVFVDGDLVIQSNSTNHPQNSTSVLSIGARSDGSQAFKGYISNVRVTKGSFLYNVDFTSPAEAMYG